MRRARHCEESSSPRTPQVHRHMTSRYPSRSLAPAPDPGYLPSLPALPLTPDTPQVRLFCGMNLGASKYTCTASDPGHPAVVCYQISQACLLCLLTSGLRLIVLEKAGTESGQTYKMIEPWPYYGSQLLRRGLLTRCSVHPGVQTARSHRGEVCKDVLPGGAIRSFQKYAGDPCG